MIREKCVMIVTDNHGYRHGEKMTVLGIEIITPNGSTEARPCFHVQFNDMEEDWLPLADMWAYKFIKL